MNKYLIGGIVILLLIGGFYLQGRSDGKSLQKEKYQAAELKLRDELAILKADAAIANQTRRAELVAARRQSNARITKLLRENSSLRDWWLRPVPLVAREHAYGVSE